MSVLRPLPPVPNIEFERKEAKTLLRRIKAGEPEALGRARSCDTALAKITPAEFILADAQLTIAREYGFSSWPRLVQYFAAAERQRHRAYTSSSITSPQFYDSRVRALLKEHANRSVHTGRELAEFVPRFFGVPLADVFAATVTEDEAKLAVARRMCFPTWNALIERAGESTPYDEDVWAASVPVLAASAMRSGDLAALQSIARDHPEWLRPKEYFAAMGGGMLNQALHFERELGRDAMRPIMNWLASLGFDFKRRLNEKLCGRGHTEPGEVRSLLDQGADANWIAPNGYSVLEHAIIRYGNAECVDLIAARSTPRNALWIAAGLGDVEGVSKFLDRDGKPTAAARANRPDFTAIGPHPMPSYTDASDEEILFEAAYVATLNGRTSVLEYLISRGFPVNSLAWGMPLVAFAAGNMYGPSGVAAVECLVQCGADVTLQGTQNPSAREIAADFILARMPREALARRLALACGVDVESVLAARRNRTPPTLESSEALQKVIRLASDDARRLGAPDVQLDHLVFGTLRTGGHAQYMIMRCSLLDIDRLRDSAFDRVRVGEDCLDGPQLPLDASVRAALDASVAFAVSRHDEKVNEIHLLASMNQAGGFLEQFLSRYGGSLTELNKALESTLVYDNAE